MRAHKNNNPGRGIKRRVLHLLCQEREIHGDVGAVELLQQRDDACDQDGAVHRLFFVAADGGRSQLQSAAVRAQRELGAG